MQIKTEITIQIEVTKAELSLITKALVGKLRPEELESAKELGLHMVNHFADSLQTKLDAAQHAKKKAVE